MSSFLLNTAAILTACDKVILSLELKIAVQVHLTLCNILKTLAIVIIPEYSHGWDTQQTLGTVHSISHATQSLHKIY